jgi:SAM-dependent methyltransferase
MQTFLHVGCGPQTKAGLKGFKHDDWNEIRFDIDASVNPDIVGTLTDMSRVETASMDALYSSHNIEHLFPHEVPVALKEFHRVLKPGGFVVLTCPDLQSVCQAVAQDQLLEPLYDSPAGPISAIDILFGHRGYIAQGNHYMAHKCGFTFKALCGTFAEAGFKSTFGGRGLKSFDLWLVAFKQDLPTEEVRSIGSHFLP